MRCFIGIGSNLGNRKKYIKNAIKKLKETEGIEIKKISNIYETEPVGGPKQGKYLNGVSEIETPRDPGDQHFIRYEFYRYLTKSTRE